MRFTVGFTAAVIITAIHWSFATRVDRALAGLEVVTVGHAFGLTLEGKALPPSGCWMAFIVDPDCGGCRQLARSVGSGAFDRGYPDVIWISAAAAAPTAEFARTFGLSENRVYTVRAAEFAPAKEILRRLGIRGVPTRIVVGADQRIRDLQLGAGVASKSTYDTLCAAALRPSLEK